MITDEFQEFRWAENIEKVEDFPPRNLNLYMIMKCADIMPVDFDLEREPSFS